MESVVFFFWIRGQLFVMQLNKGILLENAYSRPSRDFVLEAHALLVVCRINYFSMIEFCLVVQNEQSALCYVHINFVVRLQHHRTWEKRLENYDVYQNGEYRCDDKNQIADSPHTACTDGVCKQFLVFLQLFVLLFFQAFDAGSLLFVVIIIIITFFLYLLVLLIFGINLIGVLNIAAFGGLKIGL